MEKILRVRYIIFLQFLILCVLLWFFSDWNKDFFRVFLLSVFEFRIAVVAAVRDQFPLFEVFLFCFLGGMFITLLLGFLLPILEYLLQKIPYLHTIWQRKMEKKRQKHSQKMEKLGEIMLLLFVAAPLPGAGPLAGIVLAEIFKISYLRALGLITLGYIFSLIITIFLTESGFKLWEVLVV